MKLSQRIGLALQVIRGFKAESNNPNFRPYQVISSFLDKQPQYTDWNVEKAIKEGYKASVYVYSCIKLLTRQASSVPWSVYKRQKGSNSKKYVEVEDHPLATLLQKPNPFFSGQDLFESLFVFLHIAGFAPWWIVPVRGLPAELWMIKPRDLRPIPSKQDFLEAWEYDIDGRLYPLDPKQVIDYKFFNPANEYLGLSPLQAVSREVDVYNDGMDWNKVALQNRAVTDGAFVTREPISGEDEYNMLLEKIREQYGGGKQNARKPWLLSNTDWVKMALTPVEMDYVDAMGITRDAICAAFQVQPVLLGVSSTYDNYKTAMEQLWLDNIIPLLGDIRSTMNLKLTPWFGDDIWADYDTSKVPALQALLMSKVESSYKLWQMGIPFDSINQKLDMGFDPIPGGDIGYLPASVLPADMVTLNPVAVDNQNPNDSTGGLDAGKKAFLRLLGLNSEA